MDAEIIDIEKLLNNGCGMARDSSGAIVFVPGALPGERYNLTEAVRKKGVQWAIKRERVRTSEARITPACPHAGPCGGCQLLHVHPEAEAGLKSEFVNDALARIGKLANVPLQIHSFSREASRFRGKFHANGGFLGFYGEGSRIIETIRVCHVLPDALTDLLPTMREWSQKAHFKGEIHFAVAPDSHEVLLDWVGREAQKGKLLSLLKRSEPSLAGIRYRGSRGKTKWQRGKTSLTFVWNGLEANIEADQFFQMNPASWPLFFGMVRRFQETYRPDCIWDVHAGSGFLSSALDLPNGGTTLLATEPDPRAFANLQGHFPSSKTSSHHVRHSTAEQALAEPDFPHHRAQALILDPPRTGLEPGLKQYLLESGPPSLLYFSCDQATFARDLRELSETYALAGPLHVMNVCPGTLRMETATTLVRRNS
ncbi:Class I SAM-dependent RNA methyltransferase [Sulfidibacter corallicola]|uniref:Class I SAM-dependent RNA methyltransferase n=1 Tax=Sulfidibacter corallicola TaxID=2818388 RepID=A0A8A4TSG5_SULCO|nr:hypothetical protein [Sulfidibacter corallicola]QTD51988.1 class I SAM-dependent RNA methyltransferase [Sulfidibacter corallicola]